MGLLDPTPPPYAPLDWVTRPFADRGRMVCEAWAVQGYGSPFGVYLLYVVKVALYVLGWAAFCTVPSARWSLPSVASWWLSPIAFEKAIVWSMLFEVLGLGCGSGPLTGRYFPPMGGFLYFLRPGTTKLPLFPKVPLLGGATRGPTVVLLYAALVVLALRALVAPEPGLDHVVPLVVLIPLLGVHASTRRSLPGRTRRALLGDAGLLCMRAAGGSERGDRRGDGGAACALVLGRLLQDKPPLSDRGMRHDQQRPAHALRVAAPAHVRGLSARPSPVSTRIGHGPR